MLNIIRLPQLKDEANQRQGDFSVLHSIKVAPELA